MKYVTAILLLVMLMLACAPSGNVAPNQPQTKVPDVKVSAPVQTADNTSVLKTKISSLENDLANCQSANIKLQRQIDQLTGATNIPVAKEPVSGDKGSYTLKFDKPGLQYPNKYLTWDITGLDCGAFDRCTLKSALRNDHPTLAITSVTINDESMGSAGTDARVNPGETFVSTKNLPMPKVVDYQVTLRWVWQ